MRGRDGKIYFFCEGMTDYQEKKHDIPRDDSREPLFLCTITALQENGEFREEASTRSTNFSNNIIFHQIAYDSIFYRYVKQDSIEEIAVFKAQKKRFHETPPCFFSAGLEKGTQVAFSLIQKGDFIPSVYIYSLNEKRVTL